MSDYRNFADSFFSSEIWLHEGQFWIALVLCLLIITAGFSLIARIQRDKKLLVATIWVGSSVIATGMIVAAFGSYVVNDFNRNVAEKNIAAKYDDSKLKFNYYDPKTKTVRAYYSDRETSIDKSLTFTFEKNGTEPFLVKYISDDSLDTFEKAISKAE